MENEFKQALAAGRVQIGLWTSFADAYPIEIVAGAGFDWLLLDGEHAPNDLRSTLSQLQAVSSYPTHPVVRLPVGDAVLIKQYLDIGAQTLLIPMVETAEQARQLVSATRYPPLGVRGVASARASRWGMVTDYFSRAAEMTCLLVQIETSQGLENIDELVATPGVDGVFIGPSDLSAALGHLGNPGHPDVIRTIKYAVQTITRAGKAAGVLTSDAALAREYIEAGVIFCAVGVDTLMLAGAARALARNFKQDLQPAPIAKPGATY